jgi:iron complex outermembrane receptor protein
VTSHQTFSRKRIAPALLAALFASTAYIPSALAQQAEPPLPAIQVSPAPKKPNHQLPKRNKRVDAKPRVQQAPPATTPAAANAASPNPEASRVAEIGGIAGAPTTVITAQDIAHSPGQTVQDVLATQPGIQLQSLYGGVNGAGTTVDMRGFGAFATANTLILVNGRRLNDVDLAGVDLSTIPLQSIERIEITRGNSGAVLYGDNAVGGVINIVTKTGTGAPFSGRVEAGVGSFGQRFGNASATTNYGPWSTSTFVNAIHSDGYRQNNKLDQQAGSGELRYNTPDLKAFFNVSGDNQHLGLPGALSTKYYLDNANQLAANPRASFTPFDHADKQGVNVTAGFTKALTNDIDLIVDAGVRDKRQQASYFDDPRAPFPRAVNTVLQTWSVTPRLNIRTPVFGMASSIVTGIDYYNAGYDSDRSQLLYLPAIHAYDLNQQTLAGYWQQTIDLLPGTKFSYGGRLQNTRLNAKDTLNPSAPGASIFDMQHVPLKSDETNNALHIGLEQRLSQNFTVFARAARAFRTPNVDERVGVALDSSLNANFNLKTQTSYDAEGGIRVHGNGFDLQSSYFDMHLKNEIHFDPVFFVNYNLDPTHRYGSETNITLHVNDSLRLKGGFAYTRAVFEEGQYAGNDVPLVSRFTGSAGVSWNVWQKYVVLDATVRAWSKRRMDNDQANFQPEIPANATLDLKVSGEYQRYFWSFSVINAFDRKYYDYAVASANLANVGVFNAYPLPGRVFLLKIGANF